MIKPVYPILFWLPRLPVPDMSPKSQPTACDQRKDLALRRTGKISLVVCVCDEGSHYEVKAVNCHWWFSISGLFCCSVLCVIWVRLKVIWMHSSVGYFVCWKHFSVSANCHLCYIFWTRKWEWREWMYSETKETHWAPDLRGQRETKQ